VKTFFRLTCPKWKRASVETMPTLRDACPHRSVSVRCGTQESHRSGVEHALCTNFSALHAAHITWTRNARRHTICSCHEHDDIPDDALCARLSALAWLPHEAADAPCHHIDVGRTYGARHTRE
jgi:hypothetical protein